MINCKRIASVEYYEKQAETAQADAKAAPHSAGRDAVAYYTDNGQGESVGTWWHRASPLAVDPTLSPTPSPFRSIANGQEVEGRTLRDLAQGRDPLTKEPVVKVSGNGKRSAGFDLQISAPKSVSLMAAFGDEATRSKVFEAHDRAFRKALDFVFDEGMIDARRGKAGKGERHPPAEVAAAVYRHFTSRAKDPQLHSHGVLVNMCVRDDGTTGGIDNATITKFSGAIAAYYRAELASELRREFGVEVVRKGRNFEVAGVPESVIERFSKRREQIERIAREMGFNTESNRDAAQLAAYHSRDEKDRETPLTELEAGWVRQLLAEGWTPETLTRTSKVESDRIRQEREGEGTREERLQKLAVAAAEAMTRTEAVFTRAHLMRDVFEALQCEASGDEARALAEQLEAQGHIIRVGTDEAQQPVFSTKAIVEAERAMLLNATEGQDVRDFVDTATLDRVLSSKLTMADEQAKAVRHALNRDRVTVVEGSAGAGKSFAMAAVAEAARECGHKVWTIAPSWKAVDVIRSDTETAEEMARAVQGFLSRISKGEIELERNTVVIVDEAGMVGTHDMAALIEAATKADCKIVLTGDTRQLQPVVAGSPMAAVARAVGSSRMDEIRRQKGRSEEEGKWMRAASKDFAIGDPVRALEAYDRAGLINWAEDRDQTISELVRDYVAAKAIPEFLAMEGRTRPPTMAVLTGWNVDARTINSRIREELRAIDKLGPEVVVSAIPRGLDKAEELALAAGDEVIFGETVEVAGVTIRNADLATIVAIEADRPSDPVVTFRLNKAGGQTVKCRLSELVGFREEGQPHVPKVQHAYAMTVHASQGVTVDEAFVANIRGMGRESAYVAMTRHRERVRLYNDMSRVRDALEARNPGVVVTGRRGATTPEEGDAATVTVADVKAAMLAESRKSDRKQNASDFMDMREFLGKRSQATVAETGPVEQPATLKAPFRPQPIKRPGNPSPTPKPSPVDALKARMAERASAPVRYPTPSRPTPAVAGAPRGRITEQERDQMVRTNLIDFARDKLGAKIIETWSGGNGAKVQIGDEKIAITKRNIWNWTVANNDRDSGVIWGLVAKVLNKSTVEAMHWLRQELRTWTPSARPDPLRDRLARPAAGTEEALADVRRRWQRMTETLSAYLTRRGIEADTWKGVKADVRAESNHPRASNPGGVAFAHRDASGAIIGYARRGGPSEGQSWKGFSAGGTPALWQSGERNNPSRIVITESAIDTLSKWQIERRPGGVLLTATDGNPGGVALDTVKELARRHPEATWQIAVDNGADGDRFAARIRTAIEEANPAARIEDSRPPAEFKDWNDKLRGRTIAQVEAEKAERERAEEEARRRANEPDPNRPRMR